jgi:hypothetical protein
VRGARARDEHTGGQDANTNSDHHRVGEERLQAVLDAMEQAAETPACRNCVEFVGRKLAIRKFVVRRKCNNNYFSMKLRGDPQLRAKCLIDLAIAVIGVTQEKSIRGRNQK